MRSDTEIQYKKGYKYQLVREVQVAIPELYGYSDFKCEFIYLRCMPIKGSAFIVIHRGYAWDGPSGPTFDTKSFMRGSLVHDALAQSLRLRPEIEDDERERIREASDRVLVRLCKEDGMSRLRAWWVYRALRIAGASSVDPDNLKKILVAP